jgi:dipeptidyl aminopeptidase/acylaminoacyl peptidase
VPTRNRAIVRARVILLTSLLLIDCTAGIGTTGCATAKLGRESDSDQRQWPELGSPTRIEAGVLWYEVKLMRGVNPIRVWIYLPENGPKTVPAVLIGPAGSTMLWGMTLGEGDRPEHLPYVHAGFAVIAYDIEGAVPKGAQWSEAIIGTKAFESAGYGVADARLALDFALARVPQIDGARVFSAGHSSAATLSLLVAAAEPRIRGCIAYAPVCDVGKQLRPETANVFSRIFPNAQMFLQKSSPVNHIAEFHCPVFLFHADDDSVVPASGVVEFAERLKKANQPVTLVTVETGDHYDSMIRKGIPAAIRWAQSLPGASTSQD